MPGNKGRQRGRLAHHLADLKRLRQEEQAAADAPGAGLAASPPPARRHGRANQSAPGATPRSSRARASHHGPGGLALPQSRSDPPQAAGGSSPLSAQDIALFRRATQQVTPLKDSRRAILPPTPAGTPDMLVQRRQRALGVDPAPLPLLSDQFQPFPSGGDDAHYLRRGHGPDLLTGLKRGKWAPGASLDLHGHTIEQAGERLDRFLASCTQHQIRCVRIVHGKGYGSRDGEPVLKQTVRRWLMQLDNVIAYTECAENHGGAGALLVLLRMRPKNPAA